MIGAYTLVDFTLEEIAPGLIDHREWTDENGHNNALRVNGLGAPRAFATALVRETGFPDVSYGEDYAACFADLQGIQGRKDLRKPLPVQALAGQHGLGP